MLKAGEPGGLGTRDWEDGTGASGETNRHLGSCAWPTNESRTKRVARAYHGSSRHSMKHRKGFTATNVHRLSSGEVGAVAPRRSAAKSGEEKMALLLVRSKGSQMARKFVRRGRTRAAEKGKILSRKARSGVTGYLL